MKIGKLDRESDRYDPLEFIRADDPLGLDMCDSFADAWVVSAKDSKDPHWDIKARQRIAAYAAATVAYAKPEKGLYGTRTMAMLLADPAKNKRIEEKLKQSTAWGGLLAERAYDLEAPVEELGSIRSVTAGHLAATKKPAIAANMRDSTFEPWIFRQRPTTLYLVLPVDQIQSCARWLRVTLDSLVTWAMRGGLDESRPLNLILDEFAGLGPMSSVTQAVNIGAGYGLKCQFYYQAWAGLSENFPHDHGYTVLTNSAKIFFNLNDEKTSEIVMKMLGKETLLVEGWGRSTGDQMSVDGGIHNKTSINRGRSQDTKQQARDVLTIDELMSLDPRVAITFPGFGGLRPLCTYLMRYYEEPELTGSRTGGFFRALKTLLLSMILFAGMCGLAWFLTLVFLRGINRG
jgi:type IV secretion system protein VirD4